MYVCWVPSCYSSKSGNGSNVSNKQIPRLGRGDDRVGNPHRAQVSQFELFELILLLKLDRQLPVERFEATVSQSTVPSPLLSGVLSFQRHRIL